jgi:hypothetical protein
MSRGTVRYVVKKYPLYFMHKMKRVILLTKNSYGSSTVDIEVMANWFRVNHFFALNPAPSDTE